MSSSGSPACVHPEEKREAGPRIPARYGSRATEVCTQCSHYRVVYGLTPSAKHVGQWLPCPVPVDDGSDED